MNIVQIAVEGWHERKLLSIVSAASCGVETERLRLVTGQQKAGGEEVQMLQRQPGLQVGQAYQAAGGEGAGRRWAGDR